MDKAMELRKAVIEGKSCIFEAEVTADYTDVIYTFQMDCSTDQDGTMQFTITEPVTIAGITGYISQDKSALTFDDKILAFPMLADGELTPISGPWIFLQSLRSGYLTACSESSDGIQLYVDDSYEENPLHLEIQVDPNFIPTHVEIIWQNRRILSMNIQNFSIQ